MRNNHGRIQGRAGVELRKRRLAMWPTCKHCHEVGRVSETTQIDHITPLHKGGTDTDDNCQGLCDPCHEKKTAEDRSYSSRFGGFDESGWPLDKANTWNGGDGKLPRHIIERRMPSDLQPSRIPLTIVTGPPAGGKTTYIRERAGKNDLIICVDTIMQGISGKAEHETNIRWLPEALAKRNDMLRSLAKDTKHDRAWFIVSAPDPADRRKWKARLGGELVVLAPKLPELVRRIKADPLRKGHEARMIDAATKWWKQNTHLLRSNEWWSE